ncbi:chemotaxis protein CheA [Gottschalkia acidurici 9a]|uniref:Chemotaxis protein CheA n=1 Tax=Gottschalkia acidurici (strain ATCC 7906 / DSM 604 / BCRC 14475 / CIP 104303 / KCTC 5404 / NCIMB 10678 / 9a) TaxID=1128398 RepID=K0AYR0_GOTA9|nr:chemotaxis protein CheA [Gottschalkia acidurici 9a]
MLSDNIERDPMLDIYITEMHQLLEQIENHIISSEKEGEFEKSVDEIFRAMHTIKGNSSMMLFNNISTIAHAVEDLFDYIRKQKPKDIDINLLTDKLLEVIDFIKNEVEKIESGEEADGDPKSFIQAIREYLEDIKTGKGQKSNKLLIDTSKKESNVYKVRIHFEEGCGMENIRAYTIIHKMKDFSDIEEFIPGDIVENEDSAKEIIKKGFEITFNTSEDKTFIKEFLNNSAFLKEYHLEEIVVKETPPTKKELKLNKTQGIKAQKSISVQVEKLDLLMDLIGELVIAEAMVTRNPELEGLVLDDFYKATSQLTRITNNLQDVVMSVRMVPLSLTFQKMNRIVRDMSRKVNKEVELEIIGEETEVDKNIIEHISDPIMHIIRNSLDHGIETGEERLSKGKGKKGKITLEAQNSGGDVYIIVKDDGKGLDKDKILKKAIQNGLVDKETSKLTDKEIYSLILMPGFSTKESVTELSGRGVGMDVVVKNIEKVKGTISIDSQSNVGTTITIKIPLTLAIIDGMIIGVGDSKFTIPTISIKESFRPKEDEIIIDPDGNEMIMVRNKNYPILRLHELLNIPVNQESTKEGILITIESGSETVCIFANELIGEQQVVIKPLPKYMEQVKTLAGCTLLGDGSISLIIDIKGLISKYAGEEVG